MPVIMGTAGHIDHGKTTLIKALTGIDCDRLEEEKRRGITIELGFAFLDLTADTRLGIVDVPGHERFVKNMVAGASGIDFVTLVIAADEGVMPQTREHLEICSLLGVSQGIVALTKTDMVDEEWLELVQEDIAAFLQGSFLENAEMYPVSSHTGDGVDALRSRLAQLVKEYKPKRRTDLFRLPVDRIFTMKGHGTVATGTMVSGDISVGDDITVYPSEMQTKVRGLQSHGEQVQKAPAGRRTAVNLPGVEVADLHRGEVVGRPDTLFPSTVWDVELTCLSSSPRALKHRTEVHFHHGAKDTLARLYFMDAEKLAPGETRFAQVRFTEPMVGVFGDRCVVRAFSPLRTVAGGMLLNPLGRKIKRFSKDLEKLETLARGEDNERIITQLELAGQAGLSFSQLATLSNLESKKLLQLLNTLTGQQKIALFDKEERLYVSGESVERLCGVALEHLAEHHKNNPMQLGLPRGALASPWPRDIAPKLAHFLVERMLKQERIVPEQDVLRLPEHKVSMAGDQAALKDSLMEVYTKGGLTPPNLKDVLAPLELTFKEAQPVYKLLQEQGELVKVKEDMYFSKQAIDGLVAQVRDYFRSSEEMEPSDFRDLTGLSRKFTIPLMEFLDKEKITMRVGDKRVLRKS